MRVNFDYLEKAVAGNEELKKDVLLSFKQSVAEVMAQAKEQLNTPDLYKGFMHKLKGSAANLGMEDLSFLAKRAEENPEIEPSQKLLILDEIEEEIRLVFLLICQENILTEEELSKPYDPMAGL